MKRLREYLFLILSLCLLTALPGQVYAAEYPAPNTYAPSQADIEKHKVFYDDPRPYLKDWGPKEVLPKDLYSALTYDVEQMKKTWFEAVGLKASDEVGKIAPEIKPGKYTYQDLEKYPGFKDLMWPDLYNRIKPGAPPLAGNIPEFEIIPTRQYYWSLPISEMTLNNAGKTKLDDAGYLVTESWEGGYPFPKPSGPFKAQQIIYNLDKRYLGFAKQCYMTSRLYGFNKDLETDFSSVVLTYALCLTNRGQFEPYRYLDERAKDREEYWTYALEFKSPRDVAGTIVSGLLYLDPQKADNLMVYIPSLRRVRKMTSSDTQDPIMGQDNIYDDAEGFGQKLSPSKYPYKFELIEEREYLVPAPTLDGANYWGSKGIECRNVQMERRPLYVVKMTQLDPNYVYSYRVVYIDKESFIYYHVENYDRKGRLYRTYDMNYGFYPEMGMYGWGGGLLLFRDHVDMHSSIQHPYQLPANYKRGDVSMDGLMKMKAK